MNGWSGLVSECVCVREREEGAIGALCVCMCIYGGVCNLSNEQLL